MSEKLCPGCPGDPNEACCKPELRVQVWRQQQADQQPAAQAAPLPTTPQPLGYIPTDAIEQIKTPPRLITDKVPVLSYAAEGYTAIYTQPAAQEAAAVKTLERMGYSYHGAELWKPPLGPAWRQATPRVPEIDYTALIRAAVAKNRKWAQGTNGCVAFARGAEWFRDLVITASQAKAADPEDLAAAGVMLMGKRDE